MKKLRKAPITKDALQFMENYLNSYSATSHEVQGQKVWLEYIKPYIDEYQVDNYGTVYGVVNPGTDYRVVLEAHADEISWFVNYITDEGFIHVIRNGGSDAVVAPSKRINIHTRDGRIVRGVFGWPAIHLRRTKNPLPKVSNVFIDVGCSSKKEVEALGIHVGCVACYDDPFEILNGNRFVGRAIDNRMGGFMIAQTARLLKENKIKLPYTLYIVNSVMEEVGLRGAQMIADTIKPHVALVTDVGHDTSTPMIEEKEMGDFTIGKGPQLSYAPAVHNKFLDMIVGLAEEYAIPFQREANSRSTGTDTDAFAFSNGGVVSALISLPLRYMHTTVEMVHRDDVENIIRLMYYTLQKIEHQHDFRYFK